MEELKNLLTNPLKDTDKDISLVEIQNKFRQIAQKIFNDYSIKCGDKTFRLAEIEFYYYKKGEANGIRQHTIVRRRMQENCFFITAE